MMKALRTSETLVHSNETTRQYILEDSKLHIHRLENLNSHNNKEVINMLMSGDKKTRVNLIGMCTKSSLGLKIQGGC
jgi:hypothetical protein